MTAAFLLKWLIVLMIFSSSNHVEVEEVRTVDFLVMLQVSKHEYARWVDMSNVQMVTGRTRMTGWLTSATDSHSVKGLLSGA
jgi:hypothetical protein